MLIELMITSNILDKCWKQKDVFKLLLKEWKEVVSLLTIILLHLLNDIQFQFQISKFW